MEMRCVIIFGFMFFNTFIFSQVGIGTTSPEALLDIRSTNQATPTNTDGVLIPKIDDFPSTNPTVNQDGIMVFATGLGVVTKGFYYWDNATSSWVNMRGAERINDLIDGISTASGGSVFLGANSGINDDNNDNNNVGVGDGSLRHNVGGYSNVSLGANSYRNNVNGNLNVIVGGNSAYNVEGDYNVFLGQNSGAGTSLHTKSGSVFIGYQSGFSETNSNRLYIENSSSTSPLIYGEFDNNLLRVNGILDINNNYQLPLTDGLPNQVLETNGSGFLNWTTIGTPKLGVIIDGDNDTKVDVEETPDEDIIRFDIQGQEHMTLFTTNDIYKINILNNYDNILIGENAGTQLLPSGTNNLGIGTNALAQNQTGDNNIALGVNALNKITSNDNTAIGFNALGNTISGGHNVAVGFGAMQNNTLGGFNTALGLLSGENSFGNNNVFLGYNAGAGNTLHNKSGGVYIGYEAGFFELSDDRLYIDNSNTSIPLIGGDFRTDRVGVNRNINLLANALEVGGNASKSTPGSWLANSDRRLKTNINTIKGEIALEKISQLNGVSYYWNDNKTGNIRPENIQYGFIAQELKNVFPEKVSKDKLGFYQTAYGDYDAFFVEAIKTLKNKLEDKNNEIESLEERLKQVEKLLFTLSKRLNNK